jgi:hypothetical protein
MIRQPTVVAFTLAFSVGFCLFMVKYDVQSLEEQLLKIERQETIDYDSIHVLKAEWSFLTQPERLADLADRHLVLHPLTSSQFGDFDQLAMRVEKPDAPMIASADKTAATDKLAAVEKSAPVEKVAVLEKAVAVPAEKPLAAERATTTEKAGAAEKTEKLALPEKTAASAKTASAGKGTSSEKDKDKGVSVASLLRAMQIADYRPEAGAHNAPAKHGGVQ